MAIVTEDFFRFDVNSKLEIEFPKSLQAPALTVCYPFADLMDLSAYNQKYGEKLKRPLGLAARDQIMSSISMGDLFNMTIRLDPLMHSCNVRIPNELLVLHGNSSTCKRVFESKRFRIGQYVCTTFHPLFLPMKQAFKQIDWTYDTSTLKYSLSYSCTFYKINLNVTSPGIDDTDLVRPIIHSPTGLPYVSFTLSPVRWRKYSMYKLFPKGRKKREINRFTTTYSRIAVSRLPYPYASKCRRNYSKNKCITRCIENMIAPAFKKIPFQMMTDEQSVINSPSLARMKLISDDDLRDKQSKNRLKQLEDKCLTSCSDTDCDNDYTMTRVTSAMSFDQKTTSFTVATPDEPYVTLIDSEKVPANDYFMLIFSLIGFWVGLSAQDLNFVPLFTKLQAKKLGKQQNEHEKASGGWKKYGKIVRHKQTSFCRQTRKQLHKSIDRQTNDLIERFFLNLKERNRMKEK
jgi:hypothetical protein